MEHEEPPKINGGLLVILTGPNMHVSDYEQIFKAPSLQEILLKELEELTLLCFLHWNVTEPYFKETTVLKFLELSSDKL
jgi:hypothetical protein